MPYIRVLQNQVPSKENSTTGKQRSWFKLLSDNIIAVLGKIKHSTLIDFEAKDLPHGVKIKGYLTKTILSGSMGSAKVSKDSIFCYLNERPIDMPRKMKTLLTELYKQYNSSANPLVIWNIQADEFDINASVDKRDVFLKYEQDILECLKFQLTQFFEDI